MQEILNILYLEQSLSSINHTHRYINYKVVEIVSEQIMIEYGGPQVQNTTHTAKTQHTQPKHNTHSQNTTHTAKTQHTQPKHNTHCQNTTHTAKTQHTLPKHNTHCQNTTHTAKTQHTHCQNTTHTVKTQHASSDFTETQQTLSKQKKRHENTIQHTKSYSKNNKRRNVVKNANTM